MGRTQAKEDGDPEYRIWSKSVDWVDDTARSMRSSVMSVTVCDGWKQPPHAEAWRSPAKLTAEAAAATARASLDRFMMRLQRRALSLINDAGVASVPRAPRARPALPPARRGRRRGCPYRAPKWRTRLLG